MNLNVCSLTFTLTLLMAIVVMPNDAQAKTPLKEEVRFLVKEMTTTPKRQQRALDEMANYDDEMMIYLFPYFSDERLIASKEVKFLNTNPRAIEKYFLTNATKVNEVVVQYFCWRTARCTPGAEVNDLQKIKRQFEIDFKKSQSCNKSSSCRDRRGKH